MIHRKKKSFGQHFLHDKKIIQAIAEAITPNDQDLIVEIGPGEGALTQALIKRFTNKRLFLVEADRDLVAPLRNRFGVEVLEKDAAQVDWATVLQGKSWVLIGNLPYNASAAIVMEALKSSASPREVVIMVQREQGERMRAPVGEMSMLSLAIQLYTEPKLLFHVGAGAFNPPPRVESSVLHLTVLPKTGDEEAILAIASKAFLSRRKQVRKTLADALDLPQEKIAEALQSLNLREDIRPQDIKPEEWRRLYQRLHRT